MGFATHLGPVRFGTAKDGAANNCGIPTLNQQINIVPGGPAVRAFGVLPAGAQLISILCSVSVAFNGTTNTMTLGTAADPAFVAATVNLAATGNIAVAPANPTQLMNIPADMPIIATLASTDATAGNAFVTITYLLKNPDGSTTAAP